MKKIVQLSLAAVCCAFIISSCSEATANNNNTATAGTASVSANNSITFKVNGTQINSSVWNLSRSFLTGRLVLNITSNMHEQPKTINININGDKPGTYPFVNDGGYKKEGFAYGSYFPDYMEDMMSSYRFESGEFSISSIDTAAGIVNATFFGTAKNLKGESFTITDGKVVNGELKKHVAAY